MKALRIIAMELEARDGTEDKIIQLIRKEKPEVFRMLRLDSPTAGTRYSVAFDQYLKAMAKEVYNERVTKP